MRPESTNCVDNFTFFFTGRRITLHNGSSLNYACVVGLFLEGDDQYTMICLFKLRLRCVFWKAMKTVYAYDHHFAAVWLLITFSSVRFLLKMNIENELNKCRLTVINDFQNNADV